eukprot:COSAG03_NODE_19080_length_343_cov_0.627049_1_plen_72_part_10
MTRPSGKSGSLWIAPSPALWIATCPAHLPPPSMGPRRLGIAGVEVTRDIAARGSDHGFHGHTQLGAVAGSQL